MFHKKKPILEGKLIIDHYIGDLWWADGSWSDKGWSCPECQAVYEWYKSWDYVTLDESVMCESCARERNLIW